MEYQDVVGYSIPVIFVFVMITIVVSMAQISLPVEIIPTQIDPLHIAENHVQNGNLNDALQIYTEIIEVNPTEEYGWHQKGKILNRLQLCDESMSHYSDYLVTFPQSIRGLEGYEIAKKCL